MHAHDRVQLIFGQVNADLQNVVMENGHGSMLGSAGALIVIVIMIIAIIHHHHNHNHHCYYDHCYYSSSSS